MIGETILADKDALYVKTLVDALGDRAPEVLENFLTIKDENGKTFLQENDDREIAKVLTLGLGNRAPAVFKKSL